MKLPKFFYTEPWISDEQGYVLCNGSEDEKDKPKYKKNDSGEWVKEDYVNNEQR